MRLLRKLALFRFVRIFLGPGEGRRLCLFDVGLGGLRDGVVAGSGGSCIVAVAVAALVVGLAAGCSNSGPTYSAVQALGDYVEKLAMRSMGVLLQDVQAP